MDHYVRPENQWPAVLRVNVEYSEPVESAEADIGIEGLYMFLFGIQSAVRSLDRERHSGIIRNLVQEPAATEEELHHAEVRLEHHVFAMSKGRSIQDRLGWVAVEA